MREIKFRAWDKHFMINMEELTKPIDMEDLSLIDYILKGYKTFTDNYILMQFTSLKDKNGKEIYEGDIVRWENLSGYPDGNGSVRFDKGRFWCPDFSNIKYAIYPEDLHYCEIIGNIYETPELLNKET